MPRQPAGPRRIDASGTWYAVKQINGKRQTISLKTKDRREAPEMGRRSASAQALAASLSQAANRQVTITTYDPHTGTQEEDWDWTSNMTSNLHEGEQEQEGMGWSEAIDIARRRFTRRRGVAPSRSWEENIKNALRHLPRKAPLDITSRDVRDMVSTMERKGFAATSAEGEQPGRSN